MTTKEILERLSMVTNQIANIGIDPWNLPVKVLLKRHYENECSKTKEYNVLCLNNKTYNHIVITGADVPMTLKEFVMLMATRPEEKYWYVHDVFGPPIPSSSNAHIIRMGYGVNGDKILIVAEIWAD